MSYAEIDIKVLKEAVKVILDHLITDLGFDKVKIDDDRDHYGNCPASEINDMSKTPVGLDIGRLRDDMDFVNLIKRGQSGDKCYNPVHVAPL